MLAQTWLWKSNRITERYPELERKLISWWAKGGARREPWTEGRMEGVRVVCSSRAECYVAPFNAVDTYVPDGSCLRTILLDVDS